jgi:oxygen-independent coproporphyrinogen-3 oxidase
MRLDRGNPPTLSEAFDDRAAGDSLPPMLPPHLYIHVPFCARRCSYCDFSIAVRKVVPANEFVRQVARELDLRFPASERQPIRTIYLGGGTPSRLGPDAIGRLIGELGTRFLIPEDAELTIEANPDDVNHEAARAWRSAGINRISLGAQSFDERALAWMHRTHDATAIPVAIDVLRQTGFSNISVDLIFALPASIGRSWTDDLERTIALEPSHVSLYGLTVEPHAPLGRWVARGEVTEAPDERYEAEFLEADRRLTSAGFDHYEVSNFAKPGRRARHNFCYWNGASYAGVGPAAHEFDGVVRRWNVGPYSAWAARIRDGSDPVGGSERLTDENRIAEQVYLGLRTSDGLILQPQELARVSAWVNAGWATVTGNGRLILTPIGWLRLDALATDLTLFRSR